MVPVFKDLECIEEEKKKKNFHTQHQQVTKGEC